MTTIRDVRIPALLLGVLLAAGTLPSAAGAQVARLRLERLTPAPIPVTAIAPVAAPPTTRSAAASGRGAGRATISELVFTTPSGPHSASLSQAVVAGTSFPAAVIELLRGGQVYERITLSDVRVLSITSSPPGRGAEDEVVLSFGSMASTSGRQDLRLPVP
jgi:hypothetical protein